MVREPESVLLASYGQELTDLVLTSFREIQENYRLQKWKPSELDGGHFVEAVRRILEVELFGGSTSSAQQLPKFTNQELSRYENASGKDDSYRILIPRILHSIYAIRNKRGVGHVGPVSPNEMDSALILGSSKWVLAEILRLRSGMTTEETQSMVDSIMEREIAVLWKKEGVRRVLNPSMNARDQVLVLLLDEDSLNIETLREAIEYVHVSRFKSSIIKPMHRERLIEYKVSDGVCHLTPRGALLAETILLSAN